MTDDGADDTQFRLLAERINDMVTRFDLRGTISYMSPAARLVIGHAPEAMIGRRTWEFIHPDDHDAVRDAYARLLSSGGDRPDRIEYRALGASGEVHYLEANPKPIRDPATGAVVAFLDVIRDVSERKSVEFALQAALDASQAAKRQAEQSEARYRLLAETARDVTIQFDPDGTVLYVSPTVSQWGYRVEDVVGRTIADFIHPDERENAIAEFAAFLRDEADRAVVHRPLYRVARQDGAYVWLEGNPYKARDPAGRVRWINTTYRDISERVALEASLKAALVQAQAAVQAKTAFLANMSHELRTPLTSVIGFSQIVQAEPHLSEPARRATDRIAAGGKALLATINDVLDYSKIEAGEIRVDPAPTALDPLLREISELLRLKAEEKGLTLTLSGLEALPPFVALDAHRTRQVLLNLIANAVKFSERGGVELSAAYDAAAGQLQLSVIDSGPGLSERERGELFQRFRQADGSVSRRHGGTGLGLAISRGLVEAMGGQIGVESELGRGATFWLRIPAPVCVSQWTEASDPPVALGLNGRRALAVDDNPEDLELIGVLLRSVGLDVAIAENGPSAIALAGRQGFDVILMDMRMRGLDGAATARRIREGDGPNRHTPILMCTADAGALTGAAAALFDGTILKPISPGNLLGGIAAVLDQDLVAQAMRAG